MVIYDQRTAISVTRLSANAFPTFSCFSHLYNIYKISSIPFLLQNLHTSASTILSVFPLANHFQNTQSLGEYAQISVAAALDGGKEMGPFSRKLSSVHLPSGVCGTYHLYTILTTYNPECATLPSALLCGEECPMSVWSTMHKVSPCVLRLWLHSLLCQPTNPIHKKKHFHKQSLLPHISFSIWHDGTKWGSGCGETPGNPSLFLKLNVSWFIQLGHSVVSVEIGWEDWRGSKRR